MEVVVSTNADDIAEQVAAEILAALRGKPDLVLGLATGSTPIPVYQRLVEAHRRDGVDFSRVRTFNLDEYLGVSADHPRSYRAFMREHLFDGVELPPENAHFPPTEGPHLSEQCHRFEGDLREVGGVDLQLLGIGRNGHIGFNEPTSSLASRTRVKTLTAKTLADNARFYSPGEEQPRIACTMGIGTILDARRILLQSLGAAKAPAIKACVEGSVSSFWPGSALQLHPDVVFYLDEGAASELTMLDYYRSVREARSELQDEGRL